MNRFLLIQSIIAFSFLGLSHSEITSYSSGAKDACYSKNALEALTYEKIVEIIKNKNIRSIETLLPELPECFRSSYTLVHNSQSLQSASPQHPRAILFSHDGKLSCTFNGEPSQKGFDSLECYQYRDEKRKFEFFEIEFPSSRNLLKEVEFSYPNMSVSKKISCTACHSQDPRPNWEGYATWPGVYGKHDDKLKTSAHPMEVIPKGVLDEGKNFLAFKKKMTSHNRYRFLKNPFETDFAPYSGSYENDSKLGLLVRPNTRFTMLISTLVAQRNTRILQESPRWVSYQFLRTVAKCEVKEEEKDLYPEFIYTPNPKYPRLAYDRVLKSVSDAFTWSPLFRSLSQNCEECDNHDSYSIEHLYAYNNGLGDFNASVASFLLESLIQTGDSDLKKFYSHMDISKTFGNTYDAINSNGVMSRLRVIDSKNLQKACDILYDKFKAGLTKKL